MGSLTRISDRVSMAVEAAVKALRATDDEIEWDVAPVIADVDCDEGGEDGEPPHTHPESMISIWLHLRAHETEAMFNGNVLLPMRIADDSLVTDAVIDIWHELTFARQARALADIDQPT